MPVRKYLYLVFVVVVLCCSLPALAAVEVKDDAASTQTPKTESTVSAGSNRAVTYYTLAIPAGFGLLSLVAVGMVLRPKSK